MEKDLEEGGGEEVGRSESKESKELFQASPSAGQIELLFRPGVFLLLRISSRTHSRTVHVGGGCGRVRLKSSPNRVTRGEEGRRGGSPAAYRGGNFFSSTNRLC